MAIDSVAKRQVPLSSHTAPLTHSVHHSALNRNEPHLTAQDPAIALRIPVSEDQD